MEQLLDIPKKEWVSASECVVKCRKYAQSKYLQTWCGPVISVISIGTGIYYSVYCQGQFGVLDVPDTLELLLRFAYSDVKSVSEFTGNNRMDKLYEKVKALYKKNEDILTSYTKIFNSIKHLSKLDLETKSIFALGKLFGPNGSILTNYDFVMSKLYNPNEISTNVGLRDVVFAIAEVPKSKIMAVALNLLMWSRSFN